MSIPKDVGHKNRTPHANLFLRNQGMEMSFLEGNWGVSFFGMPLAQTWLAITMFKATESICSLQARKVICKVAPGQAS